MSAEGGDQKSVEVHALAGATAIKEAVPTKTHDAGKRLLAALLTPRLQGEAAEEPSKKLEYSKKKLREIRSNGASGGSRPAELDYFTRVEHMIPVKVVEGGESGAEGAAVPGDRRPRNLSEGGGGAREEKAGKPAGGAVSSAGSGPGVSAANKILASIRSGPTGGAAAAGGGGGGKGAGTAGDIFSGAKSTSLLATATSADGQWQRVEPRNKNHPKDIRRDEVVVSHSNSYQPNQYQQQQQRQDTAPPHNTYRGGDRQVTIQGSGGGRGKPLSAAQQRELFEKEREMIVSQRARGGDLDDLDLLRGPGSLSGAGTHQNAGSSSNSRVAEERERERERDRQSFGGGFGDRYETTDEISNFHDKTDRIMRELAGDNTATGKRPGGGAAAPPSTSGASRPPPAPPAANNKGGSSARQPQQLQSLQQPDDSWLTSALTSDLSLSSLVAPGTTTTGSTGRDSGKSSSRLGKLLGLGFDSGPSSPVRSTASRPPRKTDMEDEDDDDVSLSLINNMVFDDDNTMDEGVFDSDIADSAPSNSNSNGISSLGLGVFSTPSKNPGLSGLGGLGSSIGGGVGGTGGLYFGSPASAGGSPSKVSLNSLFSAAMQHGDGSGIVKESAASAGGRNALAAAAGVVSSPSTPGQGQGQGQGGFDVLSKLGFESRRLQEQQRAGPPPPPPPHPHFMSPPSHMMPPHMGPPHMGQPPHPHMMSPPQMMPPHMMSPPHHMMPPPHMMSPPPHMMSPPQYMMSPPQHMHHQHIPQTMTPPSHDPRIQLDQPSPRTDSRSNGHEGAAAGQNQSHSSFAFHVSAGKKAAGHGSLGVQGGGGRTRSGSSTVMSAMSKMQLKKMGMGSPQPKNAGGANGVAGAGVAGAGVVGAGVAGAGGGSAKKDEGHPPPVSVSKTEVEVQKEPSSSASAPTTTTVVSAKATPAAPVPTPVPSNGSIPSPSSTTSSAKTFSSKVLAAPTKQSPADSNKSAGTAAVAATAAPAVTSKPTAAPAAAAATQSALSSVVAKSAGEPSSPTKTTATAKETEAESPVSPKSQRINVMDLFARAGSGSAASGSVSGNTTIAGASAGASTASVKTAARGTSSTTSNTTSNTNTTAAVVPAVKSGSTASSSSVGISVNATRNLKAMLEIGASSSGGGGSEKSSSGAKPQPP